MATIYYEQDADLGLLKEKRSQSSAMAPGPCPSPQPQGQRLRRAHRPVQGSKSWQVAENAVLTVKTVAEAAAEADINHEAGSRYWHNRPFTRNPSNHT
jgi:ketol-acid reductoisomerase